jgi:hypothetical protein
MTRSRPKLRSWLREPLLHFLVLGAALFLVFELLGDPGAGRSNEILITAGQIENLAEGFRKRWMRAPTPQELEGLVEDHIREEVLYREAVAMGLDQDDTIIRRRMRQKMQFLFEDIAAQAQPTEEELRAYLEENPERFRLEARFRFRQLYLNPDRRGASLPADAGALLAELEGAYRDVDVAALGDPLMLPHVYDDVSRGEVARLYGEGFAEALEHLEPGRWHGPIASGYGAHLVLLQERTEARLPGLAEVRDAVARELENERREAMNEATYRRLLERYTIVIEAPERSDESPQAAAVR